VFRRVGECAVSPDKPKLFASGIDGATFDVILPMVKAGNLPNLKKIILYLGRIHRTKGIDSLVKAYANLINEIKLY